MILFIKELEKYMFCLQLRKIKLKISSWSNLYALLYPNSFNSASIYANIYIILSFVNHLISPFLLFFVLLFLFFFSFKIVSFDSGFSLDLNESIFPFLSSNFFFEENLFDLFQYENYYYLPIILPSLYHHYCLRNNYQLFYF